MTAGQGRALLAAAGTRHAARFRRAYLKTASAQGPEVVLMLVLAEALDRIDALEAEVKRLKEKP